MPSSSTRKPPRRKSGSERVFADDAGVLWSASHAQGAPDGAVVFACISDSRKSMRAIEVDTGFVLADAGDDQLRNWLREAPKIGRLT